jgi:hypothetical protein
MTSSQLSNPVINPGVSIRSVQVVVDAMTDLSRNDGGKVGNVWECRFASFNQITSVTRLLVAVSTTEDAEP